jgi:2-polyprenyl-3-methyl-5-hydroxy-6-metoxy-1,4-benzoquinol methylase
VDSEIFKPTRLKNSGPTVFGWAGNPNDPLKRFDRLKDKMKEFGARFEIATARDRSEMAEFYQGIDVLLISSVAEGTPLPLLEGLASGNFVISTDVGVAGELIREDYLGKIVNFDGADFDDAILWAIRNPDKIRKEVEHRHRFVCEERSWDRAAAELRTILENTHEENSNSLNRREDMRTEPENQYFHHLANVNPDAGSESAYQAAALRFKEDVGAALPREKDSRIIEIGSGFGHFADFLTREGYSRVSILDRDPDLLEFTRRRIGNRLEADFLGDAVEFLEKSDGTYDLIVAFDVIEHMKVQRAIGFLEAARARLEEGGCVIVRTPNMANVLAGYSRYIDLTHETGFTEFSLRHAGQLAGFSESKVLRPKYHGLNRRISNWINSKVHRAIFRIQDRSVPRVFGKNITMLFKK